MNEKKDIRDAIEGITPDPYMKTRIKANVVSAKKTKASVWKKAGAAVLAFAVLCGAGGIFASNNADNKITTQGNAPITSKTSALDFTIVAYAEENGEKINPITLDEKNINLTDLKLSIYRDGENQWFASVESYSSEGIIINAENIDEVIFNSENGEFSYIDIQKQEYDINNKNYYCAIIPLTDEQTNDYLKNYDPNAKDFAKNLFKENDYSAYFKDKEILSLDEYSIYFSDKADMDNENQLLFYKKSDFKKYSSNNKKEITAKTYLDDTTITGISYTPDNAMNYLLENPDTKLSELPEDTITITVKFKDGQNVTKKIQTSFNDEGYMQFEYIK